MKKVVVLFLGIFMLGNISQINFNTNSAMIGFDILPTAYAQEAPASDVEAPAEAKAVEVEDREVSLKVAKDIEDGKFEIPQWLGSVIVFLEGIPKVGPVITKVLGYAGLLVALLTLLASILMGLSGVLAQFSKSPSSPKWLKDAKKYVDYGVEVAKYLSMFNKQKKK